MDKDLKAQYAALENEQSRQSTELYELKIKADQQARVLENQKAYTQPFNFKNFMNM